MSTEKHSELTNQFRLNQEDGSAEGFRKGNRFPSQQQKYNGK